MQISVFGLGYVGCITAACLAQEGHEVIGVDINPTKVTAIQAGESPLAEPDLARFVADNVAAGRLCATTEAARAVAASDISLICVGTPSRPNGSLDSRYVLRVCRQIGEALASKPTYHIVGLRSTLLPSDLGACLLALSESAKKQPGVDFGFVTNPEFLREGSAIHDFYHPPLTLIGRSDPRAGEGIAALYATIPGELICTDPASAMLVKYASNAYHALKIVFANEMGRLAKELGVDGPRMMEIFCQDRQLNISAAYLKPGFAFGGSCLPKDLRALLYTARHADLDLPLLEAILPSNAAQLETGLALIGNGRSRRITLLGLAFKPNTDDLRESPMVRLAETLLGKGYDLKIYDETLQLNQLTGSNRAFIEETIPHLATLLCDSLDGLLESSDVIVVAHPQPPEVLQRLAQLGPEQQLIDLARAVPEHTRPVSYEGICW